MLPVVDAAMPRIKETVGTLVRLAEQERQMAVAAGDGLTLTPFNDMLEGMRAAMRVSKLEDKFQINPTHQRHLFVQ
jgi:hypothetical protein